MAAHQPKILYVDTSVLVSAFSNETQQAHALKILQSAKWQKILVSDWVLAEFACAIQAKVLRGETSATTATAIHRQIQAILLQGALHSVAVLREDYQTLSLQAQQSHYLLRGADALHIAVALRMQVSHFSSFDKIQSLAAKAWMPKLSLVA